MITSYQTGKNETCWIHQTPILRPKKLRQPAPTHTECGDQKTNDEIKPKRNPKEDKPTQNEKPLTGGQRGGKN